MESQKRIPIAVVAIARTIGLDRAVAFSVTARLWQLIAATGTVFLMTQFFSPQLQGFYYTIVSLLAIQGFLDLGLSGIIVLLASHEAAHLVAINGEISGPQQSRGRLAEIYWFGCRWYSWCAGGFLLLITPLGIHLLSDGLDLNRIWHQQWTLPWVVCVALNSVSMVLLPRIALLEGCNQVIAVNRMRLSQSVAGSIFVWMSIALGFGLWTLVVSNLVRLCFECRIVFREYRLLLNGLAATPDEGRINWREEIWPLQWRLAIQSVGGYFATWFIVPVTFRFHGDVAAGQIGLTWQLLTTIQSASLAWIQTRLPRFGSLLASQQRKQLETEMLRATVLSQAVFLGAMGGFLLAFYGAMLAGLDLTDRFVAVSTILIFAMGMVGWNVSIAEQSYVRLFKKDPFLMISVLSSLLVAAAIWHFGSTSGPFGLSIAYSSIAWVYAIPVSTLILIRHRRIPSGREWS
ncbi:MAG: hypothetical protein R3C59_02900 [Planctomycetaceae bacterium]